MGHFALIAATAVLLLAVHPVAANKVATIVEFTDGTCTKRVSSRVVPANKCLRKYDTDLLRTTSFTATCLNETHAIGRNYTDANCQVLAWEGYFELDVTCAAETKVTCSAGNETVSCAKCGSESCWTDHAFSSCTDEWEFVTCVPEQCVNNIAYGCDSVKVYSNTGCTGNVLSEVFQKGVCTSGFINTGCSGAGGFASIVATLLLIAVLGAL